MVDIPGQELLQHVVGLGIAQQVQAAPQLFTVVDLLDAHAPGLGAGLEHPRGRDRGHKLPQPVVVEHMHKRGHGDAVVPGLDAHGQFVPEVAHGGVPHAGDAHMLPQGGRGTHVKVIQGHDAVDAVVTGQIADGVGHIRLFDHGGEQKVLVDALPRPRLVHQICLHDQDHMAALAFALA